MATAQRAPPLTAAGNRGLPPSNCHWISRSAASKHVVGGSQRALSSWRRLFRAALKAHVGRSGNKMASASAYAEGVLNSTAQGRPTKEGYLGFAPQTKREPRKGFHMAPGGNCLDDILAPQRTIPNVSLVIFCDIVEPRSGFALRLRHVPRVPRLCHGTLGCGVQRLRRKSKSRDTWGESVP
jgi:hypothetical protein